MCAAKPPVRFENLQNELQQHPAEERSRGVSNDPPAYYRYVYKKKSRRKEGGKKGDRFGSGPQMAGNEGAGRVGTEGA